MTGPTRRVHVVTWGCQMNVYDSGKMTALLALDGWEPVGSPDEADLVLFNTCSVRAKPEHKLNSFLGRMKGRKGRLLAVAGCTAQIDGVRIFRDHPEVDLVMGPDAVPRIRELVHRAAHQRVLDTRCEEPTDHRFVPDLPPDAAGRVAALVTIQKGCDRHCTYCIVPRARGSEVSRPAAEVIDEVRRLVEVGARDITLLGQNVDAYGKKTPGEPDFADLLHQVHSVPGLLRLRFTTSHPKDLSTRVIEAFRVLPRLAGALHLPVQSGSDRVLRRMGRGYTRDDYARRVSALRAARPGLSLTTDFITGFPGETEADFEDTLSLLEQIRFDGSFSFVYSRRPGTAAAHLHDRDPVDPARAHARLLRLQAAQARISAEALEALVGREMEVLVEGPSRHGDGSVTGRTSCFRTVNLPGGPDLVGRLVPVRIVHSAPHSLVGRTVLEGGRGEEARPGRPAP
ncbi:MAG: tRNA (N6-isopentenyl adenosine(37)-C2)-methylthiotransferase MiaB [Deltaproteobacteria bacterium]|nr:tRNA (N6-isopentenyl adenosine(37)-C2)-methylthiotransferase MiaB [Deltaproteobacteria bacterium]